MTLRNRSTPLSSFLFLSMVLYTTLHVRAQQQKPEEESYIGKQYDQCSSNLSVGDCAGIGLGAAAAIAIPIFIIWYIRRRRRTKKDNVESGKKEVADKSFEAGRQAAQFEHATRRNMLVAEMISGASVPTK